MTALTAAEDQALASTEDLFQRGLPEGEDPGQFPPDQPRADPRKARQVLHDVLNQRAAEEGFEAVLVPPPDVRPDDLAVDEADAGLPHVDAGPPRHRQAAQ